MQITMTIGIRAMVVYDLPLNESLTFMTG